MLLKGEGDNADHIVGGAEWSTLSHDAFPTLCFDFMMSNPPYGKSWTKDLELMGGKDGMRDPRFKVMHKGGELSLVTRSSDGQLLFLANMVSKMQHDTPLGSRIAEVHNGSSLFTGDAGQGESNIRRWIIENDWLEAIVALPLNLFYNTGIATYIWVLSNRKPKQRKGFVQLIDASQWFKPLRKNLGKKNCELAPDDIERITRTFLDFKETPESKIFPNEGCGYWKVVVERPLRLHSQLTLPRIEALRFASGDEDVRVPLYDEFGDALFKDFPKIATALEKRLDEWGGDDDGTDDEDAAKKGLPEKKKKKLLDPKTWERDGRLVETATRLREEIGGGLFEDHNDFREQVFAALWKLDIKLPAADSKQIYKAVSWREEGAPPVIAKIHKPGKAGKAAAIQPDPLHGFYQAVIDGKKCVVEYETDTDLRDSEQIPLLEEGGIEAFIIHRAATHGIDPNVSLKPSGVPWLGDIPAHWEVWRISRFARVGNGSTPSPGRPAYWNGGVYPWLNSSQVNRGFIDSADQFVTESALRECHLPKVPAGSVLVAITGQGKTRGLSAVLGIEATINQHIAFITPRSPVCSPDFIHLALTAAYLQLRASSDDSGSTKGAITCDDLKHFKIPVPPRPEQEKILYEVRSETSSVTAAIARTEREIALMQEYRIRLTADIVTGKLDVREASAKLPDPPSNSEFLVGADALDEVPDLDETEPEEN